MSKRQGRWQEFLSQYNFRIIYRPGKEGRKPHGLTRRPGDIPTTEEKKIGKRLGILLPRETCWDLPEEQEVKIEEMDLAEFQDKDEERIQQEYNKDDEIQAITRNLENNVKEMKGVALGLCEWRNEHLWYQGKIWIANDEELRTNLIRRNHDDPLAGHGGTGKTTELVSRQYNWPGLRDMIKRYVKNCDICQRSKVVRHAPYGMLQPNEVPDQPWKSIAMDFITDLPVSEEYDTILVVIDRLTKMSHFIACKKSLDVRQFATLFLKEIIRLHSLPRDVITDRGSLFTLDLSKEIREKLGIERRLSTAFHPQTDRQTERINGILEQYLQAYVNYQQDNWNELLPMTEFAYNNSYQETIKTTPFYTNYAINPEHQLITHMMTEKITSATGMKELHDTLQAEMMTVQLRHKENHDHHRKPYPNLKSGDMVWLVPRNIHTTRPSRKLDWKKIGPFKITAKIGSNAYKLDLPPSMRIHNTFHISLLEPYEDNKLPSQIQQPRPPIQIEGEDQYELDENHRLSTPLQQASIPSQVDRLSS